MAETKEREDVELGRFDAGREQIVVRAREYKGKTYVDVRRFYERDEDEWLPGKKGCAIPENLVDDVMGALAEFKSLAS